MKLSLGLACKSAVTFDKTAFVLPTHGHTHVHVHVYNAKYIVYIVHVHCIYMYNVHGQCALYITTTAPVLKAGHPVSYTLLFVHSFHWMGVSFSSFLSVCYNIVCYTHLHLHVHLPVHVFPCIYMYMYMYITWWLACRWRMVHEVITQHH